MACTSAVSGTGAPASREYWAFTAPWDPRSAASARTHAEFFDVIVSGLIQLDTITGQPFVGFRDSLSRALPSGVQPMAMVANAAGGRFHPDAVRRLASDAAALGRAAGEVARLGNGYHGLVIDLEGLAPADLPTTRAVVRAIADSARAHGVTPIAVAIPALDTAAFPAGSFLPAADYVLVMLYDEHWSTSPPGPIASPVWLRRALARRVAEVGPSRIVAALPLYGYRWPNGRPAVAVSFDDARRDAASAGTSLRRDEATQTLRASRSDEWELWVSDAGLLSALLRETDALGVRRIALWRLGQEDPSVFPLMRAR